MILTEADCSTPGLNETNAGDSRRSTRTRLLEDTLDIAPTGLRFCFDRECFLNDDFQSDEFILNQDARGTSLEQMRDSLLQYSNILKSSLVELINQDYADFVNLSTNLVDLDKAIDVIANPLTSLESSVQKMLTQLSSVETELSNKLEERQRIREKKELLNSLQLVDSCVTRLERWLSPPTPAGLPSTGHRRGDVHVTSLPTTSNRKANGISTMGGRDDDEATETQEDEEDATWPSEFYADCSLHEDPGQRIDRVANEFIKLQFLTKKCHDHPILQSVKPRIQWITSVLQEQLEVRLKAAFDACQLTGSAEKPTVSKQSGAKLRQALSTYLVIDRLPDMIDLYRQYVLRPKMVKIFSPKPELTCKGSETKEAVRVLEELYAAALQVLDHQLGILHQLRVQRSSESYDPLAEFDCLVDGFWPETVDLVCDHLSEMFAPGDPDRFYALYTASLRFLDALEAKLDSSKSVCELRNQPSYTKFLNKWSLPVYFQIRFQEIARCVEDVMRQGLALAQISPTSDRVGLLAVTQTVMQQLKRCWQDGVYLVSLRHRFWKLTLQLLSRYASFVSNQVGLAQQSTESKISHQSTSDAQNIGELGVNLRPLIYLIVDCFQLTGFVRSTLPSLIATQLGPLSGSDFDSSNATAAPPIPIWLTECLDEGCERILEAIKPLDSAIVERIQFASLTVSRQILDVPRQYRRTNRNLPTTPSAYVSAMVSPLSAICELSAEVAANADCAKPSLTQLVKRCITQVSDAYHDQLSELLSSVRKMEDSLRKLREARRGVNAANQTLTSATTGAYTDDDKIRHQLYLDACSFRDQVKLFWGVDDETTEHLERTVKLVEDAKNEAATGEH